MERTTEERMAIANEIIRQLGGNKFTVMTGAKNYVATDTGLQFRFAKGKNKINCVVIDLTDLDVYNVYFKRIHGINVTDIAEVEGVYFDQLQDIFTEYTGLLTSMGTMGV